jgi:hypothetical protein
LVIAAWILLKVVTRLVQPVSIPQQKGRTREDEMKERMDVFGEEAQEFAGVQELQNGTDFISGSRKIVSPQIEYRGQDTSRKS